MTNTTTTEFTTDDSVVVYNETLCEYEAGIVVAVEAGIVAIDFGTDYWTGQADVRTFPAEQVETNPEFHSFGCGCEHCDPAAP